MALGALAIWYTLNAALVFPRPLEFFNELAGGATNGYRYLVDSNLDWGQSFKELANYLKRHGIERVKLSTFTFLDPAMYGLKYESLPPSFKSPARFDAPFNPAPGVYVIGATSLQGAATPDINTYAFFRTSQPTARIGNGLFVYDVRQAQPGSWVAQCTSPAAPLEPADLQAGFGRADLRRVYFDCATSWWYPSNAVPGWYVSAQNGIANQAGRYTDATLVYRARRANGSPWFEVYHVEHPLSSPFGMTTSAHTERGQTISMPVLTTGPLTLEGYRLAGPTILAQRGTSITIWTAWRVTAVPARLVSIMAHLAAADGRVVATGDGLGVPIESWGIGDLILQAHRLKIPREAVPGTYRATTGLYALDNLQRFSFLADDRLAGDQLILTDIQVE
jgi:hypothetical protein